MPKSKRTEKRASSGSGPVTSKTSLRIEVDEDLRKRFRSLGSEERKRLGLAINQIGFAWGSPHLHGGIGIRKLTPTYFECRSGLNTRLVFKVINRNTLYIDFMGNHDEVRRFVKSNR